MKKVDVYIDTGFTIEVPDEIELDCLDCLIPQDYDLLVELARQKVKEFVREDGRYIEFVFENPEGK